MGFINGRKEWLINLASHYPTKFYNSAMVEQTSLTNILANATICRIEGYNTFKLSTLRNVKALRGFAAASQVANLRKQDLVVTAPSAGEVVNYLNFNITDYGYSSAFSRDQMRFGKTEKVQVVIGASDTNLTVAAQVFNYFLFDYLQYGPDADRAITAYIPSGRTIAVEYANGTTASGIVLGANYNPGDLLSGNAVRKVTSIDGGAGTDPLITFTAAKETLFTNLTTSTDQLAVPGTPNVTATLVTVSQGTEGRNTAKFLRESYTLLDERNVAPYETMRNHQLPIDGCLYTEITFEAVLERNEIGGLSAINSVQTTVHGFCVMIKEDSDNLNTTTGIIAKLLTFLGKDGKYAEGYEFYNENYANPASALATAVFSTDNTTAWNEATHSGVVRTEVDGVTPQLANDVTQFVD